MSKKVAQPHQNILFESLKLEQVVFEVRCYNRQVLMAILPDFWEAVENRLGVPVSYTVQDGASICNLTPAQQISVDQDRLSIVEFFPSKSLGKFIELATTFYETTIEQLRTERLTRIGFRLIYSLDFDSPTSVAKAILELPYVSVPEGLGFSNGRPLIPTYFIGWDYGEKVIVYRLKGNASKVGVDLPPQLSLLDDYPDKIEKTYNQMIFDVDVFTTVGVLPGELIPGEWLKQAYEVVKSDGKCFFGVDSPVK